MPILSIDMIMPNTINIINILIDQFIASAKPCEIINYNKQIIEM
jgi:hypothetical protein